MKEKDKRSKETKGEVKATVSVNKADEKMTIKEKYQLVVGQFKKINWAKWKDVRKQSLVVAGIASGMIAFFGLIDYAVVLIKDIL